MAVLLFLCLLERLYSQPWFVPKLSRLLYKQKTYPYLTELLWRLNRIIYIKNPYKLQNTI